MKTAISLTFLTLTALSLNANAFEPAYGRAPTGSEVKVTISGSGEYLAHARMICDEYCDANSYAINVNASLAKMVNPLIGSPYAKFFPSSQSTGVVQDKFYSEFQFDSTADNIPFSFSGTSIDVWGSKTTNIAKFLFTKSQRVLDYNLYYSDKGVTKVILASNNNSTRVTQTTVNPDGTVSVTSTGKGSDDERYLLVPYAVQRLALSIHIERL